MSRLCLNLAQSKELVIFETNTRSEWQEREMKTSEPQAVSQIIKFLSLSLPPLVFAFAASYAGLRRLQRILVQFFGLNEAPINH